MAITSRFDGISFQNCKKHQSLRGLQHYCNLTNDHINFSKKLYDVKLAVEIMDRKVAAAILAISKHPKYRDRLPNVKPTADYLTAIHNLFVMLHANNGIDASDDSGRPEPHFYQTVFNAMKVALGHIQACTIKKIDRIQPPSVAHGQSLASLGLQTNIQSFRNMFNEFVLQRNQLQPIIPYKFSNQNICHLHEAEGWHCL